MVSHIKYYMGVDGGGTKCRVRLKDMNGTTLAESLGGPANIRLGLSLIWQNIGGAIDKALLKAGLDGKDLLNTSICLGLAGITTEKNCILALEAGPRFGKSIVVSDAHIACLGAFSGDNGAILISGTGSIGYALVDGVARTIGGWGFEVCDDGSAASLGRDSIRAALRGYDGLATETDFTREIINHFNGHPANIVSWVNSAKPSHYGSLAPIAMKFADSGDAVAIALVQQCATQIDQYVARLNNIGAPRICLIGGMSKPIYKWLSLVTQAVLIEPQYDPSDGALLMAGMPADMLNVQAKLSHTADLES